MLGHGSLNELGKYGEVMMVLVYVGEPICMLLVCYRGSVTMRMLLNTNTANVAISASVSAFRFSGIRGVRLPVRN